MWEGRKGTDEEGPLGFPSQTTYQLLWGGTVGALHHLVLPYITFFLESIILKNQCV